FAVSSAMVQRVVPALIEDGGYEHPFLGVAMIPLTPAMAREMGLDSSQRGALVANVSPGSPADEAGIQAGDTPFQLQGVDIPIGGDVITGVDGETVQEPGDLISYMARSLRPGDTAALTILRDGEEQTLEVTVGARPGSP
ncbi:MAG: PDZ domain-containing protein, partial [Dehalococcoidia bacterium]